MKMISIDELIEYCDSERAAYRANNCGAACTALRRVVEFAKEYAVEAEPIYENPEKGNPESEAYCFDCIHNEVCRYCPHDGCDFKEKAEPVKHGRWEHGECSVCGASPLDHVSGDMYVEVDYYPNYCPNCGSKNRMDGDSDDQT